MAVQIIGSGIGGLSSAVRLGCAGVKVSVSEQNRAIGNGGDNFQAVRNYDLGVDFLDFLKSSGLRVSHANPINKIVKYAPSGKSMTVVSDGKPLFYVFRRGSAVDSIDSQLYNQALDLGVSFSFNEKKMLSLGDIVASGPIFRNVWGYGAVFEGVNVDSETIHLFMDNNYAPKGGYIYAIPFSKDKITIAAMTFDLNAPLPFLFEKFIKENVVVSDLLNGGYKKNYFSGYAYSNVPQTAQVKNMRFVGCAAGFVEAARGFGVKYAIESGLLAADSIIENKSYDASWKSHFEKDLLSGLKRRFFFENLGNDDLEKMVLVDKVKISNYEKIPGALMDMFGKISFNSELSKWRKRYSVDRLF